MPSSQHALMPSVLDRLIDVSLHGTASSPWYGIPQMVEAVQRDLEELLNSRETHQGLCDGFPQVQQSPVSYGLPDLASLHAATEHEREEIGRAIEEAVRRFEPRLKNVRAVLQKQEQGILRSISFRLEARLCADPAPDVAFDTTVELATGHYRVRRTQE